MYFQMYVSISNLPHQIQTPIANCLHLIDI